VLDIIKTRKILRNIYKQKILCYNAFATQLNSTNYRRSVFISGKNTGSFFDVLL